MAVKILMTWDIAQENEQQYFEFAIGEFTGGELTTRNAVQATGNGSIITIGLEADINGSALSLQEINVLALMGKVL